MLYMTTNRKQNKAQLEIEFKKWLKPYLDSHDRINDLLVMTKDIDRVEAALSVLPELKKAQAVMNEALYKMEMLAIILRADYLH